MKTVTPNTAPPGRPGRALSRPTRLRWFVAPGLAVLLVAAVTVMPSLAGAQAPPPQLPPVTPQQLLMKVHQADVAGLSGTISFKNDLGLPELGDALPGGDGGLVPSLLVGERTAKVWVAGEKLRVAFPTSMAESAIIHNGNDVWLWESERYRATHLRIDQIKAEHEEGAAEATAGAPQAETPTEPHIAPTPQALADELLAEVDPSTRVFVRDTATVAGRPAYELVLAPRSDISLVADVVIAVDSATGLPLRVQVLARDSGTPALDVGFTSIDFSVPGNDNFEFTPPAGATVTEADSPEDLMMGHERDGEKQQKGGGTSSPEPSRNEPDVKVVNDAWETIVIVTPAPGTIPATGEDETVDLIKRLGRPVSGDWGSGRLLHSSLLNVLLLDDGRIALGPVTQAALEAAV